GPLHGVPFGVKDIIDTAHLRTERGSQFFAGRQADEDAEGVGRLRKAGAVVLGKTVTTEFAYFAPGPTANPHRPDHTPGGSSSGSAAAVADFQVPFALGTQTA
ncbi:MAG: amidase, partial [Akkermansiaceae bacterium]|nr:amidase [Akkermansiaceae bacterium]